ncbi:MAG TPA: DMT family transporter [Thermoanaerobaculia bacterium]|nr:DMT family transporter [Thermoanaerobaculia bacterium]
MRTHWLAVAALFLVASAWGATFTLVKSALTQIAPEPFIVFRFAIAAAVLLILAFALRQMPRSVVAPGAIMGLVLFVAYWGQTRGLLTISPSRSAFLTGLYVVLVPFADRVLYKTRIPIAAWIGSALALFGTALLIGGFEARPAIGDLLTMICAVASALHVVLSAKLSVNRPALGLAAMQVLVVGLAAAPVSAFALRVTWSREVAFAIVFTAIVTTALAFVALMWGQARVTATEAAVILAFEPVAASVTSIAFAHEPVTPMFLTGAALILTAIVLSQLPESPRRDPLAQ